MIRLGGPLQEQFRDPEAWVSALKQRGYRAALCPVDTDADGDEINAFARAAKDADIVIAEVGTWSNPLSPDKDERTKAIEKCKKGLQLAEDIGACCCVNIAGTLSGEHWYAPHEDNLIDETFTMIVETTREIIDAVNPKRTFYTLEPMAWLYPDSPETYLDLIRAMDRQAFAAHLDIVNMINTPRRYFRNSEFIRECVMKLGPYIKSCHAKDTVLHRDLTVHLEEVRPGLGHLDYATFLKEIHQLPGEIPMILEHLPNEEEYRLAAEFVTSVADREDIPLSG